MELKKSGKVHGNMFSRCRGAGGDEQREKITARSAGVRGGERMPLQASLRGQILQPTQIRFTDLISRISTIFMFPMIRIPLILLSAPPHLCGSPSVLPDQPFSPFTFYFLLC